MLKLVLQATPAKNTQGRFF